MAKKQSTLTMTIKVKHLRKLTDAEMSKQGWDGYPPPYCLELADGTVLFPSSDEEGNAPGVLFGTDPKGTDFSF